MTIFNVVSVQNHKVCVSTHAVLNDWETFLPFFKRTIRLRHWKNFTFVTEGKRMFVLEIQKIKINFAADTLHVFPSNQRCRIHLWQPLTNFSLHIFFSRRRIFRTNREFWLLRRSIDLKGNFLTVYSFPCNLTKRVQWRCYRKKLRCNTIDISTEK